MDFDWLQPLTDEQLDDILKIQSRHHEWRRREAAAVLAELRRSVGNAFVALDLVVLDPVCDECHSQLVDPSKVQIILVWPELADGRLRLYDPGSRSLYFFDGDESEAPGYAIVCHLCGSDVSGVNDTPEIVRVTPSPFSTYFGLDEVGPKRARGKGFRKWLAELYGNECFHCKKSLAPEDVTLDHIVARAVGGEAVPANLQLLCVNCNGRKRDEPIVTVELALDFPLRPAPSDSYEGLIW